MNQVRQELFDTAQQVRGFNCGQDRFQVSGLCVQRYFVFIFIFSVIVIIFEVMGLRAVLTICFFLCDVHLFISIECDCYLFMYFFCEGILDV